MTKKLPLLVLGTALFPMMSVAQQLRESYFEWWPKQTKDLPTAIHQWEKGQNLSEDDNFFISRVKPRQRFRNTATQVNKNITPENDKRLLPWMPMGNPDFRTFQDGVFDSEVFSMWSYISSWGDWNCPIGRVPAPLLDAAHKNGIGVSSEYGIPFGALGNEQHQFLIKLSQLDPKKAADFMHYYGADGLGFNSEYNNYFGDRGELTRNVSTFLAALRKNSIERNPNFENIWYDGTNDNGTISFDRGLGNHNKKNFGDKDNIASSLFFNYNSTYPALLSRSIQYAKQLGRNPLYLYAGMNLQGADPKVNWTVLKNFPISIGLWGAHSRNMFWESRNEQGSSPDVMQETYMRRIENWFTGGRRNPANLPPFRDDLNYSSTNTAFPGMSSMMTAKSALNWDLAEAPFITYFNLGNGKFFNWMGVRQNDNEWYNLGVQDYLPTWRFWFAPTLLQGKVEQQNLDAKFIWKDAYFGGSCLSIFGTTDNEYLHLFKTKYALQKGDEITLRYKLLAGKAHVNLVLTAEGEEAQPISEDKMVVLSADQTPDDVWNKVTFKVGDELNGKTLALVALHFQEATKMKIALGEFSIVRGQAETPAQPEITAHKLFGFNHSGVDGKIIFNMPNDKPAGEPCYNEDVKTSLFKIYSQQKNSEPVCVSVTNSWAAMIFAAPMALDNPSNEIRFGVSAVSLDMKHESEIAWTDYEEAPAYVYNDAFSINKKVIKPNEEFTIGYQDKRHKAAKWEILSEGQVIATANGVTGEFTDGLPEVGIYTLRVTSLFNQYDEKGNLTGAEEATKDFPGYIAITSQEIGALPAIQTLTANGKEADVTVKLNETVDLAYTGRPANGAISRGVSLKEKGFVFKAAKAGLTDSNQPYTICFWTRMNVVPNGAQLVDIRDQGTSWPQNHWGHIWADYGPDHIRLTIREAKPNGCDEHTQIWNTDFVPGMWTHVAIVMETNERGELRDMVYVNGKPATPRSWKCRAAGGEGEGRCPIYMRSTAWWPNADVMIGMGRRNPALNGDIDEVKFFTKSLTHEEVVKAMTTNDILDQQTVYYSFDKAADKNWFDNEIASHPVKGARVQFVAGENEGTGHFEALEPLYTAGTPFVPGKTFKVETQAEWKANKATLSEESGNDEAGKAKVSYAQGGDYEVTLTLTNSYGSDTRTFKTIKVDATSGIHDIAANTCQTYPVGQTIFIEFAQAGDYTIQVFNAAGQQVAHATPTVQEGRRLQVNMAQPGVYILRIAQQGKTIRQVKLLCQ